MTPKPPTPTPARPGSLSVAPGELIEAVTETAHQYQQVGKPPRNAVTAALTDHAEQQPDTHADNLYLVAYIHHHFGIDEEELIHASGSRHATTWTDVTTGLARSALTQVVDHILTGEIRPTAITPKPPSQPQTTGSASVSHSTTSSRGGATNTVSNGVTTATSPVASH